MKDATTSEEGDETSSYESEESEEEAPLQIHRDSASDVWMEGLADIKSCMGTLDATQNAIVSQLASLEKVVLSVQEDVTWLRGDVRVLHEVVEKMADYVSMMNNTVAEVDGVHIHRSPEGPPWGKWPDVTHAAEEGLAPIPGIAEDERVDLGDEEPSHIRVPRSADSAIRETQVFDRNTGAVVHRENSAGCKQGKTSH